MTLVGAVTDLSLTLQHGVNGSLISENSRPEGSHFLRPEELGCWRAHANIWNRIISGNIETALILDDDVDWDIHVCEIFAELSRQMALQGLHPSLAPLTNSIIAPYGLNWDILYLGSNWDIPNWDNLPPGYLYHDPYAPNRAELGSDFLHELEGWGVRLTNQTRYRLLAPSWYPIGTLSYAVTKRGARKLLYHLGGYNGISVPVDLGMINLIQGSQVEAYTIIPPLITLFRTGGPRDSDIRAIESGGFESDLRI